MSFKEKPLEGTAPGQERQRWFISFENQWDSLQFWQHQNWRDFTVLQLSGEYSKYSGRWEIECCVLGLGFTVTYIFDFKFSDSINDMHDQIIGELEGRTGAKVEDPTGILEQFKGKPAQRE